MSKTKYYIVAVFEKIDEEREDLSSIYLFPTKEEAIANGEEIMSYCLTVDSFFKVYEGGFYEDMKQVYPHEPIYDDDEEEW